MLTVALLTKDPLFSYVGVPLEFEWVVGIFITAFSSWQWYFKPLKERVIALEVATASLQSDMSMMKEDISLIKEYVFSR